MIKQPKHTISKLIKNKKFLYIITTSSLILFWAILYFIGYLFTSSLLFPIISLIVIIIIFLLCRKLSLKYAVVVSLISLSLVLLSLYFGFEESYCWKQGELQDPKGDKFVTATQEDAGALKGFNVIAGEQIGLGFRTHMLCHKNFNFVNTFLTNYIL